MTVEQFTNYMDLLTSKNIEDWKLAREIFIRKKELFSPYQIDHLTYYKYTYSFLEELENGNCVRHCFYTDDKYNVW